MEATLTTKGQITLPKDLRDALNLKTGDKLVFEEHKGGGYLLRAKTTDVRALKGMVKYKGPSKSLTDMDRAVQENVKT